MKCIFCGVSVQEKPQYRTKPLGQSDAGWACLDCIKEKEPELYRNIIEDTTDVEKDLTKILYPRR